MKKITLLSASVAILLTLSGCGGGSSSNDTTTNEGYFVDSPVEGLEYETSSGIVGETDKFGKFRFHENDSVKFKIGGLKLGEVFPDKKIVSPKDFIDLTEEQKELQLQFLQSLDYDHNVSNGIQISAEIKTDLKTKDMEFAQITSEEELINLSDKVQDYIDSDFDGHIDVNLTKAKEHFEETQNMFQGHVPEDFQGQFQDQPESNVSDLSEEAKQELIYMWNEEKAAKDLYTYLGELYSNKTLLNIGTKSEARHEAQIQSLLEKYNINIEGEGSFDLDIINSYGPGEFNVDEISSLYDTLKENGEESEINALKVGCLVEKQDIYDLNKAIMEAEKIKAYDVEQVFENLKHGSENHLKAFDSALKEKGVTAGCSFEIETPSF